MITWHEREVKVSELRPYERNPRKITEQAYANLKASLQEMGYHQRIIAQPDLRVVGGHQRIRALQELGVETVKILVPNRELSFEEFKRLLVQDNLPFGEFDLKLLQSDFTMGELKGWGMPAAWFNAFTKPQDAAKLADRFGIPPFSVFNAREGWWQERKAAWLALGIQSELGRDHKPTSCATDWMKRGPEAEEGQANTSIFDPVLCEIAYQWFCPPGGNILDPFAGGSVRGIVASKLGRQYHGIDLSVPQVEANIAQAKEICGAPHPTWDEGDSSALDTWVRPESCDFVFSCPPYFDLEVYSDSTQDLSNMAWGEFLLVYRTIIAKACAALKPDRFACFVVGEVRDDKGMYRNLVGETVQAFLDAGMEFYNEAILVTAVGSLPVRVGRQFTAARKLGKTHQNVLVFVKGDPKAATQAIGEVDFALDLPKATESTSPLA